MKSTIKCIATIVWGGGRGYVVVVAKPPQDSFTPNRNASANTTAAPDKMLLK